jgi:hypothetical protein
MASVALSHRVGKVVGYPPLSEMGDRQRREFQEALIDADDFEDLPGKWQAAILNAEDNRPKLRLSRTLNPLPPKRDRRSPDDDRATAAAWRPRGPLLGLGSPRLVPLSRRGTRPPGRRRRGCRLRLLCPYLGTQP